MSEYLHEQTSLTAGTIADDDELATDLGHLDTGQRDVSNDKRFRGSKEVLDEPKIGVEVGDGGKGEGGVRIDRQGRSIRRVGKGTSSGCRMGGRGE